MSSLLENLQKIPKGEGGSGAAARRILKRYLIQNIDFIDMDMNRGHLKIISELHSLMATAIKIDMNYSEKQDNNGVKLTGQARDDIHSSVEKLCSQINFECQKLVRYSDVKDPTWEKRRILMEHIKICTECVQIMQKLL